jgi:hypothetical protein
MTDTALHRGRRIEDVLHPPGSSGPSHLITAPTNGISTVRPTRTGISFGGSRYQGFSGSLTERSQRIQYSRTAQGKPAFVAAARVRERGPQLPVAGVAVLVGRVDCDLRLDLGVALLRLTI